MMVNEPTPLLSFQSAVNDSKFETGNKILPKGRKVAEDEKISGESRHCYQKYFNFF